MKRTGNANAAIIPSNGQDKYQVRVSEYAYDVLTSDRQMMPGGGESENGFLNRVIAAYADRADASVGRRLEEKRAEYRSILEASLRGRRDGRTLYGAALSAAQLEKILDALIDDYGRKLTAVLDGYRGERSVRFQVNGQNYAYLSDPENWAGQDYYLAEDGAGGRYYVVRRFLSAVLEEYARKTPREREEILLRDRMDLIRESIENGRSLLVTMTDTANGIVRYAVRPYALIRENGHIYLACRSAGYTGQERICPEDEIITSIRVQRIRDIREFSSDMGKLTDKEKAGIREAIARKSAAYLLNEIETVKVALTPLGERFYRSRGRKRPAYSGDPVRWEDRTVYTFECNPYQIRVYFINFDREAEVLSPQWLRDVFAEKYRDALRGYEENPAGPDE